jgi:hypothetical protein
MSSESPGNIVTVAIIYEVNNQGLVALVPTETKILCTSELPDRLGGPHVLLLIPKALSLPGGDATGA